jgi:tRNA modification GTPase
LTTYTDTIAAQTTPPGRGGVSVIRISGSQVKTIIAAMLNTVLPPRHATYLPFLDEHNVVLDEGLAIFFPHPHSFTGEDVLELQGHGGPVVVDLLLQRILHLGARLARPGEFSERAFLNGKLDLAQAEAIADLIDASSQQAARCAMRSLQGDFSKEINQLNEKIIQARLYVEAAIDFSDEEIDFLSDAKLTTNLQTILQDLQMIQQKAQQGSFLREGISAVIVGAPNVGKSSLLNYLSGKELAIVTDIPGTTRDVLRDTILIDGMPMHIIDTAGLRESADIVELEGIRRAHAEMEQANIILYVLDTMPKAKINLPGSMMGRPVIFIRNKIDLTHEAAAIQVVQGQTVISLSVKTGVGIELLKNYIKQQVGFHATTEGTYLARRRHLDALKRAAMLVQASLTQLNTNGSSELAAEDLRLAHQALSEITGQFTADDLLGRIFSTFCIGK